MLPGNERQDVEKGGKSEWTSSIEPIKQSALTFNILIFFSPSNSSNHATISIRSIDSIECCVSDAFQTIQHQKESHNACWSFGIRC